MPLSINPSLHWEGNDGNWSTFAVQIGNPGQVVNLLPSTSGSQIWPVHNASCAINPIPDCGTLHGGLFDPLLSKTFMVITSSTNNSNYSYAPFSDSEASIGFSSASEVGTDSIILDTDEGPKTLVGQTIVAFWQTPPFLGLLGLSAYDYYAHNLTDNRTSPLETLRNSSAISALSYGYTAGAYYRNEETWGSLTMGGYDKLRGDIKDGITVPLQEDNTRDLVVWIDSITIGDSPKVNVGSQVFIDSVVPEIWLPRKICTAFESEFELNYTGSVGSGYYIVTEDQHTRLLNQNKSVTFRLAADGSSPTVDITFPYAAFDLNLSYPKANITNGSTEYRYFPLQIASQSGQYFLGRTFLQEAYLAVDYHKKQFHVSQAKVGSGWSTTNLVCLGCNSSGLSTGAIAGIAVGIAVVVLAVLGFFARRWVKKRKFQKLRADLMARNSIGGTTIQEDEAPNNMEFFKPSSGPPEEEIKPELDGQSAVPAGFVQYGRHELASNGSVRRTSQQSGLSRGTISPITQRMPSHSRNMSYGSSNGQPSPSLGESPSPGQGPWSPSSHPSPGSEMREVRHESGGQWYFELPANGSRPALQQVEPVEVRADPRSPVERTGDPDSLL